MIARGVVLSLYSFNRKLFFHSLIKDEKKRWSSSDLIKDAFIVKYMEQANDLDLIKEVIEKVKLDKIEA
jgi:hypothetical protein